MKFDFSDFPLQNRAFSEQPMTLVDPEPRAILNAIMEIALVETGHPTAREDWQRKQLQKLLDHAVTRSPIWQKRIGSRKRSDVTLASLPVLSREELQRQVQAEGSLLLPGDGIPTTTEATSGSTGFPVRFFVSAVNYRYNIARSLAQYFMEGRDLSCNRTALKPYYAQEKNGVFVERKSSWLGPLQSLIKSGINKEIGYRNPDPKELGVELGMDPVGYLVCSPFILETLLGSFDLALLKNAKIKMCIPWGESISEELAKTFAELAIPVQSSYSSQEVGPIAFECESCAGHFHIATSNVMVEIAEAYHIDGVRLGRVLVTALHSYATPVIRYDLGDLARLREDCPCGHKGPTIENLYGRLSSVLKHRDGTASAFYVRARHLAAIVKFKDYRIRQTDFDKLAVEIGGRSELTEGEKAALGDLLKGRTGPGFCIEIKPCEEIDWGGSQKRLAFRSEV